MKKCAASDPAPFFGRRSQTEVTSLRSSKMVLRSRCAVPANKSIDTDILSAGFAGLLSAGQLQRYTAKRGAVCSAGRPAPDEMKVAEVLRLLHEDGWYLVATRVSHRQFKHPTKPGRVTVGQAQ